MGSTHCGSRAGKARPGELSTSEALGVVEQLRAMRTGEVVLIGFLSEENPGIDYFHLKGTGATVRAISVGDRTNLEETVRRYNGFVDNILDADFGKPAPRYKIQRAPFYAAWSTPVPHDTRAGLRINGQCQVVDMQGEIIPGLYCGGESAGGFSLHGLARCLTQGYIAGAQMAAEPTA